MAAEQGSPPQEPPVRLGSLGLTGSGSLSVGVASLRYDHRCWRVHWNHVLWAYSALEADYQVLADRNKMMFDVDAFFIFSTHLCDWMKSDTARTCALTPEQLDALNAIASSEPAIVLGRAIANTQKHHTRTGGTTAFVDEVSIYSTKQRTEARIHVVGSDTFEDALDLATRALDSWRGFMDRHDLQTV